jgi:hypothetical protein
MRFTGFSTVTVTPADEACRLRESRLHPSISFALWATTTTLLDSFAMVVNLKSLFTMR